MEISGKKYVKDLVTYPHYKHNSLGCQQCCILHGQNKDHQHTENQLQNRALQIHAGLLEEHKIELIWLHEQNKVYLFLWLNHFLH